MGRGDKTKRTITGRNPLFGPRQRPISPQEKRRLQRLNRQRQSELRRQRYSNEIARAGEALVAGDERPIIDLFARPTPPRLISTERQALHSLAANLVKDLGEPWSLAKVEALQQIRSRAQQRRMLKAQDDMLQQALLAQLGGLVVDELYDRFSAQAPKIGPLPRIWTTAFRSLSHLRSAEDGELLCGRPFNLRRGGSRHPNLRGESTPLNERVTCSICSRNFCRGAAAQTVDSQEWLAAWQQHRSYHQQDMSSYGRQLFGWDGPRLDLSAQDAYQALLDNRLEKTALSLDEIGYHAAASALQPSSPGS